MLARVRTWRGAGPVGFSCKSSLCPEAATGPHLRRGRPETPSASHQPPTASPKPAPSAILDVSTSSTPPTPGPWRGTQTCVDHAGLHSGVKFASSNHDSSLSGECWGSLHPVENHFLKLLLDDSDVICTFQDISFPSHVVPPTTWSGRERLPCLHPSPHAAQRASELAWAQ